MANDPAGGGFVGFNVRLPAGLRGRSRVLRSARSALAFITAAALVALLGILYIKTQGVDIKRQNEILFHFRQLKEIDARWDVEVLRARTEFAPPPFPADRVATLSHIQQELAAAARGLNSAVLAAGLANLNAAFAEKADLVAKFRKAKPVEQELLNRLSFLTAGPRVDSLTGAFNRELEETLAERERYRVYLIAYAGALLILIGYLAARLLASYRLLNKTNLELEQRVVERTRELSDALVQLKESEAQLIHTEKMSSLGRMVAGIAHEVNTPLAYIKNSLGSVKGKLPELTQVIAESEKLLAMLQAGNADPQQLAGQFTLVQTLIGQIKEHHALDELQELVKDGLHGIEQISDIVVNLKNFSRLDRSTMASFNLNEGLENTLLLTKHEIKILTVRKQFGNVPPITCSPSQINQVFLNLIHNAIQAIEPGQGTITLTTRSEGDYVVAEVEDTGRGIAPDVLPRIFDPFFTTKDVGKGAGLGLSIAHKIVEQHGGKITVDSTEGSGTKFTIMLPLTPGSLPNPGPTSS